MRYLPLAKIDKGMFLANTIFSNDGKILLKKRTKLSPSYIKRIENLRYTHLYIYNNEDEKWDCSGLISDKIRAEAMAVLWDSLISAVKRQPINANKVIITIEGILRDVLQRPDALFNLIDTKTIENYIYNHSINVCILSILMGKKLELEREQLKELAIGAFLHDLGTAYIGSSTKKINELSTQDTVQIRQHTKYGFEILKYISNFSFHTANIAYQHHEREDGSGYPMGLIGKDLHLYSKIVAVADSYDAMISDRAYREAFWSGEALAELEQDSPLKYDPKVVDALIQSVAVYPVGSVVLLSNGEQAVVVEVTSSKTILQHLQTTDDFPEVYKDSELQIEKRLA
jgi:HD-GYP domain-containing protein (c-di-GMP phosphodiesterase class II)